MKTAFCSSTYLSAQNSNDRLKASLKTTFNSRPSWIAFAWSSEGLNGKFSGQNADIVLEDITVLLMGKAKHWQLEILPYQYVHAALHYEVAYADRSRADCTEDLLIFYKLGQMRKLWRKRYVSGEQTCRKEINTSPRKGEGDLLLAASPAVL